MLQGINDLMNKPIKDKKDKSVKLNEILNNNEKIYLHENVAN